MVITYSPSKYFSSDYSQTYFYSCFTVEQLQASMAFNIKIDEEELRQVVQQEAINIGQEIFANSQENIVKQNIVDEGTLLKSGSINITDQGVTIEYSVPYADVIEFGRMPGSMPPTTPIKGWVRRKLGVTEEKEQNRIAFAIAKDIEKNGTQPRPYLQPAIDQARRR